MTQKIKKPIRLFFEISSDELSFNKFVQIGVHDYKRGRYNFTKVYLTPQCGFKELIDTISRCVDELNKNLEIKQYGKRKNN